PARLPLPDNTCHVLPRFDADVMAIETQLLLDWYWPAAYGEEAPAEMREEFNALWRPLFMRLQKTDSHWLLRDYHSPNLLRLDGRDPPADIGVIDFQDALRGPAAYDLVSLLQDARVDVSAALEQQLFEHYCAQIETVEPDFDRIAFAFDYAALGAQRNTKILGIFARLARRDGKPQYLSHLPRIWDYLARDLDHNDLAELRGWYELNFPPDKRAATAHAMMERKQPV
ncbi:MAG TPA: bifunctional tRNA (adenosine(37)-N6)-threonylcarbamoyltransferase complex ATPase subunit type 1 TsaE/phosphotransferase, partial [Rhizobiales bacterium]|nr:bifunctional tRNA (adenosine(37)-N6)-threonylcarbamoyltransferase complex ATPase subunit type 1 TsaE/phosphotransferase [Hyphomicrobiales bacterium]